MALDRSSDRPAARGDGAASSVGERIRRAARLDFAPTHRQPSTPLVVVASAVSVGGSLLCDWLAVRAGTAAFPATRGFSHFRFSDYATLTIIGVLVACAAWPVVTRATSAPRWLFVRMAVVVVAVLWLPDVWLLVRGETAAGVAVLMVMHLAIAIVTYNALVHLAPVRTSAPGRGSGATGRAEASMSHGLRQLSEQAVRRAWNAMAILVALELVAGVASVVVVPYTRGSALVPARGTWIYVAHGALGIVLAAGAVAVLVASSAAWRMARIGAVLGAVGVGVGLAGGVLASYQSGRLLGMGLMMIGVVGAGIGYLVPALEAFGKAEAAKAQAQRTALGGGAPLSSPASHPETMRAGGGADVPAAPEGTGSGESPAAL